MPQCSNIPASAPDTPTVEIAIREGARWTAVMTKPRCEKAFARYCEGAKVPSYLPLRKRVGRYQRRTVTTWLPMFPGYVFVQYDPARPAELVNSHKIVRILDIGPTSEVVLVEELCTLQKMEELGRTAEIEVMSEIVPGKTVRITGGPLNGLTGIVERRFGAVRVTVNVDLLGQSVAIEMDVGDIEVQNE
ncbi:MAG TPA: transcription termination/antitermination NusG family protein [Acidobacteriota bacterium]|nr:transcription termination/antitermination NusG family protein [Acidobacteriota bacterium]